MAPGKCQNILTRRTSAFIAQIRWVTIKSVYQSRPDIRSGYLCTKYSGHSETFFCEYRLDLSRSGRSYDVGGGGHWPELLVEHFIFPSLSFIENKAKLKGMRYFPKTWASNIAPSLQLVKIKVKATVW